MQHKQVNYLGCVLDETIVHEPMALRINEKINPRSKFLHRQIWFIDVPLRPL